jgi:hypothetical protein
MGTPFFDFMVETNNEVESENQVVSELSFYLDPIDNMNNEEYLELAHGEIIEVIENKFEDINSINNYFGNEFDLDILSNESNNTCSICLNEMSQKDKLRKMRNCEHIFRKDCIDNWLLIKSNCPYCRKDCSKN